MRYFLSFFIAIASSLVFSAPVELTEPKSRAVGAHFQWQQPDSPRSIEFIATHTESWRPLNNGDTSFGMVGEAYWFQLQLINRTDEPDWLFQFDNNTLQMIDVWVFYSDGRKQQRLVGANYPTDTGRQYWLPKLNFALELPKDQMVTLYFRVDQKAFLDVASKITPVTQGLVSNLQQFGVDTFFFGLISILIVYHLLLFLGTRESFYLMYTLFIASALLMLLFVEGYLYLFFDESIALTFPIGQSSIILMSTASLWFLLSFFETRKTLPWANQIGLGVALFAGLIIALRLFIDGDVFIFVSSLFMLFNSVLILFLSFWLFWKHKIRFAIYYLLGWSIWILWGIYLVLGALKILPVSLADSWLGFKISLVIQFLFFAWLLSLRVADLRKKAQFAEAKNTAKGELLARVSHELRTPLNGIVGISDMLAPNIVNDYDKKLLGLLKGSCQSLVSIVNDLLEVSRLNNNEIQLKNEPVKLKQFINDLWYIFELQIKEKGLTPTLVLSEGLPDYVLVDPLRLKQVLTNLLGNSCKFTEQGEITLTVDHSNNSLNISVQDTGRGIPGKDLGRIFEPFEQLAKNDEELQTGTGLGLHITREIIQKMGGEISVESTPQKGSLFFFSIPALSTESPTLSDDEPNETMPTLNILVAEDNSLNFLVLENLLKKLGHRVKHAENGVQALEWYERHHEECDVILMDCEMPFMDGYTAAKKIRDLEQRLKLKYTPILAVTAHVFEEHYQKITSAGMDAQINKPFDEQEIAEVLSDFAK